MQSVVAGQAPITLEWKKYLGSKTEAKTKKNAPPALFRWFWDNSQFDIINAYYIIMPNFSAVPQQILEVQQQ